MQHTIADRPSHNPPAWVRWAQRAAVAWVVAREKALRSLLARHPRRWRTSTYTGLFIALASVFSPAMAAAPTDYQLKAVFLFNFTRFIEWPPTAFPDPAGDLIIGILGEDPFGADLDRVIRGETRERHSVTIARYKSINDIGACHILFISASERPKIPAILKKLSGTSVLTVADDAGLARKGVMINLVTADNRVKMNINLKAANAAGLTLSSKLLRAATLVDVGPEP